MTCFVQTLKTLKADIIGRSAMIFLYDISTIFYIIMILSGIVLIGFLITWIVAKIMKNKSVIKVGKIGSLVALIFALVGLVFGFTTNMGYNQIAAKRNRQFNYYAKKYEQKYIEIASTTEDVGNSESKDWSDAIDDSDSIDDFDVEDTVSDAVDDNSDDIDDINDGMKQIKKYVNGMKKNETKDHKFSKYQKSYTELKKFTNLVTSPTGSYNSFTDKLNDYDESTVNAYKDF
ncbi:DUF3810 family protein [Limosilactobacillus coleohominis]|uniref:DUF3810 family protein n=1 Tax=Limosilactobacillus coleohominis TaxID=181675 RepID=UPI0034E97789